MFKFVEAFREMQVSTVSAIYMTALFFVNPNTIFLMHFIAFETPCD
jgi:hypothetical protein